MQRLIAKDSKHQAAPLATTLLASLFAAMLVFGLQLPSAYAAAKPDTFGTLEEYSTYTSGEKLADSFYYTDAWFFKSPEEQNDALALLSMQLVAAAVEDGENGASAALLTDLGFEEDDVAESD